MSPLDSFWNGVLSLLTPLVTPDWGKLIALIPWLLLLLVVGWVLLIGRAWVRLLSSQATRSSRGGRQALRPLVVIHVAVIVLGAILVALSFIVGSKDASWTGAQPAFGLLVNVPLLLLGLGLAIASAGNGARLWELGNRDEEMPEPDSISAAMRRNPKRVRRVLVFLAGVVLTASAIALGTVPGAPANGAASTDPMPVAVIPLLLLGLVLAVGAVGSAIAALWSHDPDFDAAAPGDESSALVASGH
jgi:hypothetical protein